MVNAIILKRVISIPTDSAAMRLSRIAVIARPERELTRNVTMTSVRSSSAIPIVNVETLNKYDDGTVVNAALLLEDKVIKKELSGLKILGNGELTKKLTVQAAKFSASAKEAIEKAGGTAEVI